MESIDSFHYPPELFELMISTIPLLNRSKKSVILFFRGAGIPESLFNDISRIVENTPTQINKYEIARTILVRLNEKKDQYIRERRELLKRVIEFESFTNCWAEDQYKAKGLVAEIKSIVNVKDSFTRMKQERENELKKHSESYTNKINSIKEHKEKTEKIKKDLFSLFSETNAQLRGKKLEFVLNSLFKQYNILIREAFTRKGENKEGIIEQIDGVVEIDSQIYLVEMKWTKDKISSDDIYAHLGRIYHRTNAQGIYISATGYTDSGIIAAKEALINKAILILSDLSEFVDILENEKNLLDVFKTKITNAIIDKNPYSKP